MRKCTDCKYCFCEDIGFSNWTVEGTECSCLLNKNPQFPIDRFYGEEPILLFAESCSAFSKGDPVEVDVDRENGDLENYSDDPEVKAILKRMN